MRAGPIRYVRGRMDITDRAGLKAASCDCYRVITEQFARSGGWRRLGRVHQAVRRYAHAEH